MQLDRRQVLRKLAAGGLGAATPAEAAASAGYSRMFALPPFAKATPELVEALTAVGARGGPRIISAVLQTVINMIDHEMNIQQAIDAPRIHHQWLPDLLYHEPFGMSPDTRKLLESRGHKFNENPGNIASATGIAIEEKTGVRLGAIDSRSDGEAIGY